MGRVPLNARNIAAVRGTAPTHRIGIIFNTLHITGDAAYIHDSLQCGIGSPISVVAINSDIMPHCLMVSGLSIPWLQRSLL